MATPLRLETQLDDALAHLRRDGGPVPVRRGGETVAVLMTPAELERLEDERDAALLRVAMVENHDSPTVTLEALATELGIVLRD